MNIQPSSSAASIAGTPRAVANGDARPSRVTTDRKTQQASKIDEQLDAKSITQGDHAGDRHGDGRQLPPGQDPPQRHDELDLSVDVPTTEPAVGQPDSSNRIDYQA